MTAPGPNGPDNKLDLRLVGIEYAGFETNTYRFARSDGGALPPASPGSHIAVQLPNGLERQYSLILPGAAPRDYLIGVKREMQGKGGSAWIHDKLRVGETLSIHPPRNNFALDEAAAHTLLIGGGIGITPLISMATRIEELGGHYRFHAAFRSAEHAILSDYLAQLSGATVHLDDAAGGFFPMADAIAAAPPDAHLYCCGPTPMIEKFLECARANARDEAFVHVEFFSAAEEAATAGNFTVELARSGLILDVPPGKSILSVVREAGVSALSSCEAGVCAACETEILEGVPDHRDAVLSPAERKAGKSMMICCSGSLTKRLVLDL